MNSLIANTKNIDIGIEKINISKDEAYIAAKLSSDSHLSIIDKMNNILKIKLDIEFVCDNYDNNSFDNLVVLAQINIFELMIFISTAMIFAKKANYISKKTLLLANLLSNQAEKTLQLAEIIDTDFDLIMITAKSVKISAEAVESATIAAMIAESAALITQNEIINVFQTLLDLDRIICNYRENLKKNNHSYIIIDMNWQELYEMSDYGSDDEYYYGRR